MNTLFKRIDFKTKRTDFIVFIIFSVPTIIYVLSIGPIIDFDTIAYSKMRLKLLPVFPVLYRCILEFFGNELGNHIIQIIYIIFTLPIIHWFSFELKKAFKLKTYVQVLILISLYLPIYLQYELLILNYIGTEGLSFGLYMLIVISIYKGFIKRIQKYIWISILLLFVMNLLRGQFKFIFPLLIVYEFIYQFKLKKLSIPIFCLLIGTPILASLCDASYHKLVHKEYTTTPFSYISLNAIPMFVSNESDKNLISDEETKALFVFLNKRLHEKKAHIDFYQTLPLDSIYQKYYNNAPVVLNQTIHTEGTRYLIDHKNYSPVKAEIVDNKHQKRLLPILIQQNFISWFSIVILNFKSCFGSWVFIIICMATFIWLSFQFLFKNFNTTIAFLWFLIAIVFANALTISIAGRALPRYVFYNYWLIPFVVGYIIDLKGLKDKH